MSYLSIAGRRWFMSTTILCAALGIVAMASSAQAKVDLTTQAAIERGKVTFQEHCAVCHGTGGKGNGPAAGALTKRPTNLAALRKINGSFPAVQIKSAIKGTDPVVAHGIPAMMVWGAIFRADANGNETAVDARISDLIAFIESIQEK
jgi:mono/diheme cytochrome c family protein